MTTITPPVGVAAALSGAAPRRTIFAELTLAGRVAVVTGGHRGIGLEQAVVLAEAGAIVYCLDLPSAPNEEWLRVQKYVAGFPSTDLGPSFKPGSTVQRARLEYVSVDVTDQKCIWDIVETIAREEGRLDICIACAGILAGAECLEYPAADFQKIININVNGVLHTAQAAGRQMVRLGTPGSIILIASMSGSIANQGQHWTAYNTSKSAVVQMARSLAVELGQHKIRVNSISPGYIMTKMTETFLKPQPELHTKWASQNPLGRLGLPHELRGVTIWLASDTSTFCTGSDIIVDGGHRAW